VSPCRAVLARCLKMPDLEIHRRAKSTVEAVSTDWPSL
jgi:hypothetical protein